VRCSHLFILVIASACSDPPPAKSAAKVDTVPMDDHAEAPKTTDTPPTSSSDPSKPYTTKVGESSPAPTSASSSSSAKGAVSKSECDRVMDKYLELEIASNPQLKGVSPDIIEAAKQMARSQHGESPCTATRAQYNCAMAATSTVTWQKCMK
jgi:hypothetical protein